MLFLIQAVLPLDFINWDCFPVPLVIFIEFIHFHHQVEKASTHKQQQQQIQIH